MAQTLTKKEIATLEKIRSDQGWSYDRLRIEMGAKFSAQTLLNAMKGAHVYESTHAIIMDFLQRK